VATTFLADANSCLADTGRALLEADKELVPASPIVEFGMVRPSLALSRQLDRHLPSLREELEKLRDFRNEQLAHLLAHDKNRTSLAGYGPRADGDTALALDEVRAVVTAGARRALADIELALARMNDGCYGQCRACGSGIPLAVLTAIPTTTLCWSCHPPAAGAASTVP
jgi:DnaK suppressor protein